MDERAHRIADEAMLGFAGDLRDSGAIREPVEAMLQQRAQASAAFLGVAFTPEMFDPLVAAYAAEHAYDQGVLTEISGTTRDLLAARLQQAIESGMTYDATRAEVRDLFDGLKDWQVQRIARTELANASRYGSTLSVQQLAQTHGIDGITAYLITTAMPCPVCENFAQWTLAAPLSVEEVQDALGGEDGLHPNCMCDIGYRIPDLEAA